MKRFFARSCSGEVGVPQPSHERLQLRHVLRARGGEGTNRTNSRCHADGIELRTESSVRMIVERHVDISTQYACR